MKTLLNSTSARLVLSQVMLLAMLAFNGNMALAQTKYWQEANLSRSFKADQEYKVAILPMQFSFDVEADELAPLQNTCRQKLALELAETENVTTINHDAVDEAVNLHRFGGSALSPIAYPEIAKQVGANVIATCSFSKEEKLAGKRIGAGIGIIQATVTLTEVATGKVLYSGKARASNPLSLQDEAEYAIQLAMFKMPRK